MTLFSQLDQAAANTPSEQAMMVRYRTRFHRDVIFSQLSTNPDKSFADIAAAVAINEPTRFLPQPWPPILITDESTLTIVSLIKMKDIVNVGLGLPAAHSALLTDFISRKFPKRLSIDPDGQVVISAEVCINEKGEVTYSFDTPEGSTMDASLLIQNGGRHGYVKGMLILGMQTYLESMTKAR